VPFQDKGHQSFGVVYAIRRRALRMATARAGQSSRKQGVAAKRNARKKSFATPQLQSMLSRSPILPDF